MKIKALLPLVALLLATTAQAGWERKGQTPNEVLYVDPLTLKRNGQVVKGWTLLDYKKPTRLVDGGKLALSTKQYYVVNCEEETAAATHATDYSELQGGGDVVDSYKFSGTQRPVSPDSMGGAIVQVFCSEK